VDEFGWLIPVPNLPTVQKGSMKCFYELSQYTQRHFEPPVYETRSKGMDLAAASLGAQPEPPVKVVEIKTVGAYEIAVLSTKDAEALAKWLGTNRFYFPADKTDVLESYVKQHWYFVAAKINLRSSGFHLLTESPRGKVAMESSYATETKLASGELNPLQISFASDRCVFPLKISSVNGKPSEVQVYVLSPEPLLEKAMLEKKLPEINANDLAHAKRSAESYKNMLAFNRRFRLGITNASIPLLSLEQKHVDEIRASPVAGPDELLPYAKLAQDDLLDTAKSVSRLAGKSWWLTKQTWTFKPEEMRDLVFDPAIAFFADKLDSQYGYYAVQTLQSFKSDAMPALLSAMRNKNPAVRRRAVSALDPRYTDWREPSLQQEVMEWLKDPEPKVREVAAGIIGDYSSWKPANAGLLVELMSDENVEVRWLATSDLEQHLGDITNFVPRFQTLLKDKNPDVRPCAFEVLRRLQVPVSREDLSGIFAAPVVGAVWNAYEDMERNGWEITDTDVTTLLQNPDPNIRGGLGLKILYDRATPQSVAKALPLLRDSEMLVRISAARTLRALTGQHFTYEQPEQWEQWWQANKTNFVVQLHPEELRPRLPNFPPGGMDNRPPPATPPGNLPR
jgi:HEAT repeat protein